MKLTKKLSLPCLLVLLVSTDTVAVCTGDSRQIFAYAWNEKTASSLNFVQRAPRVSFATRRETLRNVKQLANELRTLPRGRRALIFRAWSDDVLPDRHEQDRLGNDPEFTGPWWDHGVAAARAALTTFAENLAEEKVTLDFLALDMERGLSNWEIGRCPKHRDRWAAIDRDPRKATLGWPLTEPLAEGFCERRNPKDYLAWNALMRLRVATYLNEAFYQPLSATFPKIGVSNYGFSYWDAAHAVPDPNGHAFQSQGQGAIVGTHQSPVLYGALGQIRDPKTSAIAAAYSDAFDSFRFAVNHMRAARLASSAPIAPWIANRGFTGNDSVPMANTDFWNELIIHAAISGADHFLYWNAHTLSSSNDDRLLDRILGDVNQHLPCGQTTAAFDALVPADQRFVLSGARSGDQSVWRLTADSKNDRFVKRRLSDGSIRLTNDTVSIQFADSRGKVFMSSHSNIGYWIVQPGDAPPPVIRFPAATLGR